MQDIIWIYVNNTRWCDCELKLRNIKKEIKYLIYYNSLLITVMSVLMVKHK